MKRFKYLFLHIVSVCAILCCPAADSWSQRAEVAPQSWQQVRRAGKGNITIYWYESQPFISKTDGVMKGIEYEIMEGFRKYLRKSHDVDLTIIWKQTKSFGDTYASIRDSQQPGIIGASAFSITPERKKEVAFSAPYMSDISVIITSKRIPIAQSSDEFNKMFAKLTAITIPETTYEQDILKLKNMGDLPFNITYIPSSANILDAVAAKDSAFAFIDLPVYMMVFNENPAVNVKRQNLFPVKRKGYAFIYPLNSDWAQPLSDYFSNSDFPAQLEKIISGYIDIELYHFIESLAIQSNDLVVLLTKEKEIQYKDLLGKSEQIQKETRARNFLIVIVTATLFFLMVIVMLYRKQSEHKRQIEVQRCSIELKNQQLEKHNQHLVALNEEKNNLIHILAHDLRTPINHVQGLAEVFLLSYADLPKEQRLIIERITEASERLGKMISNILDIDSIENNRIALQMDEVAISPLVNRVVSSFEKQARIKNIHIESASETGQVKITGDVLFLVQIFENLISNAIKFSGWGKKIEVSTAQTGDHIRVNVRDQGPGLTEHDRSLLFKKFQRLSAKPTNGENSTGLGLSIVKKYVELMGGRVWCESEPGRGANFIVEFRKA